VVIDCTGRITWSGEIQSSFHRLCAGSEIPKHLPLTKGDPLLQVMNECMALQTLPGWLLTGTCEEFYVFGTATFYQVKAKKKGSADGRIWWFRLCRVRVVVSYRIEWQYQEQVRLVISSFRPSSSFFRLFPQASWSDHPCEVSNGKAICNILPPFRFSYR
jgi:hypothetical protein